MCVCVCVTRLGLLHVPKVNQSASTANSRRNLNWQSFVASVVVVAFLVVASFVVVASVVVAFVLPDFIILFNK